MSLRIDERGAVTDCTLTADEDVPDTWVTAVRTAAMKMTFIPGHRDGKPMPMLFVEPVVWRY